MLNKTKNNFFILLVIKNASISNTGQSGDYYIGNSDYNNGLVFRDGEGGTDFLYNDTYVGNSGEHGWFFRPGTSTEAEMQEWCKIYEENLTDFWWLAFIA